MMVALVGSHPSRIRKINGLQLSMPFVPSRVDVKVLERSKCRLAVLLALLGGITAIALSSRQSWERALQEAHAALRDESVASIVKQKAALQNCSAAQQAIIKEHSSTAAAGLRQKNRQLQHERAGLRQKNQQLQQQLDVATRAREAAEQQRASAQAAIQHRDLLQWKADALSVSVVYQALSAVQVYSRPDVTSNLLRMLLPGQALSAQVEIVVTQSGHFLQLDEDGGFVRMDRPSTGTRLPLLPACESSETCSCGWATESTCLDDATQRSCRDACCCALRPDSLVPEGWAVRNAPSGDRGKLLANTAFTTLARCIDACSNTAGCRSIFFNYKFGCNLHDLLVSSASEDSQDGFFKYHVAYKTLTPTVKRTHLRAAPAPLCTGLQPNACVDSTEGNNRCAAGHWVSTSSPTVPLVQFGAKEGAVSFDSLGYTFCSNGQNGEWKTLHQPSSTLMHSWRGQSGCAYTAFSQSLAMKCLAGKWLHMDGDSLTRDQYYDLLELLGGMDACSRNQSHSDQFYVDLDHNVLITLGFNPALQDVKGAFRFEERSYPSELARRTHTKPDFWVWSPGLWFDKDGSPDSKAAFSERLRHVARSKPAGTTAVLRNNAGYLPQRMSQSDGIDAKNSWHQWINSQSAGLLDSWELLDAHTMVQTHPRAVSHDGIHCSGVVSKTITNALLNMLCPNQHAPGTN